MTQIRRDDVLRHVMAGGGGWGNPLERDPETLQVDREATKSLRATLQRALARAPATNSSNIA